MKQMTTVSLAICLALGVMLTFGATMVAAAESGPELFACVADGKLEQEVAPEAVLETFSCFKKKWGGAETIHFKVSIKNVSDQPQRYRVNIFLDNGQAVGGLIPRKTKQGLVEPGKSAGFSYPVRGMTEPPESVLLKISTMSQ